MVHIYGQADLIDATDLEGVRPVKQSRGRRTLDRLLAGGLRLVASREFDSIMVADIARAADCSVGAFYLRFRDKDAFFRALIAHYVAESRDTAVTLFETYPDDRLINALVLATGERFRRMGGLLRSAIRKRMEDPTIWDPIRLNGHFVADRFIAWLGARYGRALSADEEIRVRFAFQVLYGTLNNALVNAPGPLAIEDADFLVQLERSFRLVLLSPGAPPALK
jgi:AcrR family transcriptional regulator